MTDLSDRISKMSSKKRALLAQRLRREIRVGPAQQIPRCSEQGPVRLSFAQERLWFLDRLDPGGSAYLLLDAVHLHGDLDVAALRGALRAVIQRHESLRTVFNEDDGVPVQVVVPDSADLLTLVDLEDLPAESRHGEALELARREGSRPFDLGAWPLCRVRLVRLDREDHLLIVVMHHITSDAWSMAVFVRELVAFYAGAADTLPELPVQYRDYAVWQRGWLSGEVLETQLAYWRGRLSGAIPELELPVDHPRSAGGRHPASFLREQLGPGPAQVVRELGRRAGATSFMTLLAVFQALFCRLSGQREISVGTPVAGRRRVELEGLIGFFVNTLVLRSFFLADDSFLDLLAQVRSLTLEGQEHQDLPFEKLVAELQPERTLSHSPLFQVMFVLQNAPPADEGTAGLVLERLPLQPDDARFDVTLSVVETGGGLSLLWEYNASLFEATTIARMASHFAGLLAAVAAQPEARLAGLSFLSELERAQLLIEWNDTAAAYPDANAHSLFAAQAALTPQAVAAISGGEVWSYAELNRQAEALAECLAKQGVREESVVPILAERSLAFLAGVLGIWKAGAAYLPLDPRHPADRHRQILEQANPALILVTPELAPVVMPLAALHALPVLELRLEEAGAAAPPRRFLALPDNRRRLAYVIYTSGSTGVPKGAMVVQQGMVNHLCAKISTLRLTEADVVAQTASQCFDISVWQLIAPLLVGGCVHIYPDEIAHDPSRLLEQIEADGISILETVPSLLRALLEDVARRGAARPSLANLRWMIPTGEALPPELCRDWAATYPTIPLLNAYGPTECSDDVSHRPIPAGSLGNEVYVPIGRPILNTRLWLLDSELQPVPLGVKGEIWVSGDCVGRGYLQDPQRTAQVFLPDPFASAPGGRMYRTGDLGRRRPDGTLEFLGRIDHQVKVRGFRIELGEIELALAFHPDLREAVVMARGQGLEQRLVAYVVPAAGREVAISGLRHHLFERLPEHMVPSAFLTLPALPLTPNGKVDRHALARMELMLELPRATGPAVLLTPVEEVLAGIWAEVLGLDRIFPEDSFFALGGHSLLAARVVAQVRAAFAVELPLRALFEGPTLASAAAAIDSLLGQQGGPPAPPLLPVQRPSPLPLSFSQERLWFLDRLDPGTPTYNLPLALGLRGPLSMPAFAASLSALADRHEAVRTTFRATGGEPEQVIAPALCIAPVVIDLSGLPLERRDAVARALTEEEALRPFDLKQGPLLRAALLRLEGERHVVLLTLHHITSDGWSLDVLLREVGELYNALVEDRRPFLPALPVQYADFAIWQRGWLTGDELERQLTWWRRHLEGAPGLLDLPLDRPRPAISSLRGSSVPMILPSDLWRDLRALARARRATPFMVLLTVFQTLLARWTGQHDVVVGTPVANRNRAEIAGLIGFFVNTLALRLEVAGDPAFVDLLARIRETSLEAYIHQDLPFERLVEELRPERNLSHSPVFQVMLVLQNVPMSDLSLSGLALEPVAPVEGVAKFDLNLFLSEDGSGGSWSYRMDLFDQATIQRLAGTFAQLLRGAVKQPDLQFSELPLLTEAERHQIAEWNATAVARRPAATLDALLAEQAARVPDAVAVVSEEESLTYGELATRARRLAKQLHRLGVGPEVRVGICAERSPELVVGLLAILEAGGAYVPLDPSYPAERLTFLLEDALVPVLLTQERLRSLLGDCSGVVVLCLDAPEADIAEAGPEQPGESAGLDNLAYVIYTSGSTGRPKGAMNTHQGIVNRLLWMQEAYGLTPEDRVLQKTPFSFDVSVWEFFWPLLVGARLVLARPEGHKDPDYLVRLIREEGITHLHFVPSMLQAFLAAEGVEECRSLRRVMTSGEALPPDVVARFFARLGPLGVELHNLYGPTEAAVDVTAYPCRPGDELRPIPIGRPIANCTLHILDASGLEAPVGVGGELLLGGVQLARGYLRRPDLTAERFVPDPIGTEPGARLYRTGDLARYRPDGAVEFLGRIDHQVKIRGFRIELGEIELALAAHPDVREAIVIARGQSLEQRLVAYVVPAAGREVAISGLRRHLAERLPEYMVPSTFVTLATLPLTPNGKVDRRGLPEPAVERAAPAVVRTPAEELIAQIWAEVLGLDRVGPDESFFDLGGHSLLATQVVSRLRQAFGVEVPLRRFFHSPTVAGLAAVLEPERGEVVPPIAARPHPEDVPLSFAQERLWFLHQLEPLSPAYNLPVALRLQGCLDEAALEACFGEIVRRHESLRTTFGMAEERPVQRITAPAGWRLPITDLTALPDAVCEVEVRRLAREEAGLPFDLAAEPLLRTWLLRLSQEERILLLDMHHIVSDGWSMGVLVREAVTLYTAAIRREPSPLPELAVQYADFALWQREWLSGDLLERQLAYWKRHLAGAPPVLDLPLDRPRPAVQTSHGGRRTARFPGSTLKALRSLCRHETATPFMGLLAAFAALLRCCTGQEDLVIGAPIANRTRPEIEPLIGFFVNTLALRIDLSGDPDFQSLLARVRSVALEAYAHQDLPFEKLIEELQPDRDRSRQPLVQGVLALQNVPLRPIGLSGLTIHPLNQDETPAKFDLSLFLEEEEEDGFAVSAEYNRDLFDSTTVDRLLGHFERLLAFSVAYPGRRLSQLTPLDEAESQQLLHEWNDTAAPVSAVTIPELFARQAARNPEGLALVCDPERWSYRELDERSTRLAKRLRRHGVGPEKVIALHLEPSADLIAAMLAVLKAGGAYLPLDPSSPMERLSFLLSDSRCGILLTHRRMPLIPANACERVFLDEELVEHLDAGSAVPGQRVDPENLAYVIYTSGSTGWPKGVAVRHAGLANLVAWHLSVYPLSGGDRGSQLAGIAFDASVWEIWPPLVAGACLYLADEETRTDPERLVGWLARNGITTAFASTPLVESLLQRSWPGETALRFLLTGGDALRCRPPAGLGFRLVNHYGPTENSVVATAGVVEPSGPGDALAFPPAIGKPVGNVRIHIVDRSLDLVPLGAAGELLIGGESLSRSYLHRPDLTAERFVPDPWGDAPGGRLYRTGDLARWLPSGELRFLSRVDRQVKVRGFRIELGEIETALVSQPGVREAVVEIVFDDKGEKKLFGYVVLEPGTDVTPAGLRDALGMRLPAYMVPSGYMVLPSLPLTPNGKVDRRALPEPSMERGAPAAARTPAEELIAQIWAEVLGVDRVGIDESFFDLGGHSLLATQVVSRLRQTFGVEVPLRRFFQGPTVVGLAAAVESERGDAAPPIVARPRPGGGDLPLSFAQERLWFIDQLEPGSPVYNIPGAMRLTGDLDVEVLAAALREIMRRHEVLRTVFALVDGAPVQRIFAPEGVAVPLPVADLTAVSDPETVALDLVMEEAERRFDLAAGPLARFTLLKLGEAEHFLLVTFHHVVSDVWSLGVFVRELQALYGAFVAGGPSPLPELAVQYADYAVWQRAWLAGEVLEEQLSWWRERLAGSPTALELPTDRPRPAVRSFRGGYPEVVFSEDLSRSLRSLGRESGATLFMTLLAVFEVLLLRWSGQQDLLVGSPVANRERVETEPLLGFFINTLVLRSALPGRLSFRELLAQVRETALGAWSHQSLPLEKLVEELQPDRNLGQTPLFQVMFNLLNAPMPALRLPGLQLDPVPVEPRRVKLDLTLTMLEAGEAVTGSLGYQADLFDRATVARMVGHLTALAEAAVADPGRSLAELPMLPEAERHQLLAEWSVPVPLPPEKVSIHELIEQQAERTPEAPAVAFAGERLTYGELDRQANRLAGRLRALGVGRGDRVGLYLERSLEAIVAVLAVLKAGGCYVPLDPAFPAERLGLMLADAGARVLLTHEPLRNRPLAYAGPILDLDAAREELARSSDGTPRSGVGPEDLIYVIFTSGSTGRPKGVALEHRHLASYVRSILERLDLPAGASYATVSSLAADLGNTAIFPALTTGGCLHVVPAGLLTDPLALAEAFGREPVDCLKIVPSHLAALLDAPCPERILPRRRLVLGGEAAGWELVERVRALAPECRVLNHYGPTETAVGVLTHPVEEGLMGSRPASVPLGRPLAHAWVLVVDSEIRPVPAGVPGELLVGGASVARGYLDRPELTAERFLPDPLGRAPGDRCYRTGDLARRLADGRIEFLGRIDHQVKIRGHRVEPGEVAAVLTGCPGVRDAVVVARPSAVGELQLVAYAVAPDLSPRDLRDLLVDRVSEAMMPQAFVVLPALPLTPNGKVDLRALPAPQEEGSPAEGAPRTVTEELLAGIWCELLGRRGIGAGESFFEAGGHSLLATRLVSRVRQVFDVEIPLRAVFEAPALAALAARIESAGRAHPVPPVRPVPREADPPLSFAQERLWFLDQLEPGSSRYNLPYPVLLKGRLEVDALLRTLREIVRRHESLRTTFPQESGRPVQRISGEASLELTRLDLASLPEPKRRPTAWDLVAQEVRRPFNLAQGPLVRATLARLEEEEHAVWLTLHHIVCDGWSRGVLSRELQVLYEAFAQGRPSPLPELAVQYADYAVWQREWLQGEALEEQLAWWRERLAGAPAALDLPTDRPRPAVPASRGALHLFDLRDEVSRALTETAAVLSATPFMVLLAAFQSLLVRYTGQERVNVGTPIANRTRAEIEPLIGFFVNTLALPGDLSGRPSFREAVERAREVSLGAYAHQDLPFERLVSELQPERDLQRSPLFQVMLILQNAPQPPIELPGLSITPVPMDNGVAKFDLTLVLAPAGEELSGGLEYDRELFDTATVERFAGHFRTLLAGAVADPGRPVWELPVLTAGELDQVVRVWNETGVAPREESCLHELFLAQAARSPRAEALAWEGGRLTYGELAERSERLARHLAFLGVGPEVLVGVCAERTPALVVALLAVLRAGGAYVPLDPTYPKARLAAMLDDSRAPVVVSESAVADRLPAHGGRMVLLDGAWEGEAEPTPAASGNLAYVIYTSGSTGRPKGVAIEHRSAVTLARWGREVYSAGELSGVLFSTSVCFDLSVFEVFVPLSWGGRVIVAENVLELSSMEGVTLVNTVPSAMAELVRAGAVPASVRTVNLAGEALKASLVAGIYGTTAVERVYNLYGPSEDTTYSTFALMARGPERTPPVGRPLPFTRAYVLDREGNPVPVGVPGELFLGGAGLSRGYLERPELTAERYLPDPFGAAGGRLYRTGDLARRLPSGELLFLSRVDRQVKVRGFRIELGEIETALVSQPGVREAVVETVSGDKGEKKLFGYVVLEPGTDVTPAGLRDALGMRLPAHMVPSGYMVLPSLPLMPNGKVDRRALPEPSMEKEAPAAAARTPAEELIAQIWAEVLGVDRVGINESFFDLGGHSLLATQVVSRLRQAFGVEVPLRRFFQSPTVAGLAAAVESERGETAPPIAARPRPASIPLSFAQERLWFLYQFDSRSTAYNLPAVLRLHGRLDESALEACFGEIVRRHEALRTTFAMLEERAVQRIAAPPDWRLPIVDLAALPEALRNAAVRGLVEQEGRLPFDLESGWLLRTWLLRLSAEDRILLLNMHHIVSDGWSMGVLVREAVTLYAAAVRGEPSPLAELPVQYADFALWQREWLSGEVLERQLDYWRRHLAGAPERIELPTDRPRPPIQAHRGAREMWAPSGSLAASLRVRARQESATPFMALLAGFAALLGRYTGQDRVVIGTPIANRNRTEIEPLIGFFVNTLALHLELEGDPSLRDLLAQVRGVALEAYAHQDVPFEKLVEELQPERDLSRQPLFQVMLALQNLPAGAGGAPGLAIQPVPRPETASKFDLSLFVEEEGLSVVSEHDRDLFDRTTIQRLLRHFERFIAAMAESPESRLSECSLLEPSERHQVVAEWNDTRREYRRGVCLHELITEQVARTPEAVAVVYKGAALSYRDLERLSNRLANRLRKLGVGPEVCVAVAMERSLELIVALHGVLRAGGAYVPLDPEYPKDRLEYMLSDSRCAVLLTQERVLADLPPAEVPVLCLDETFQEIAGESGEAPATGVREGHLAYMIYTSGSTGRPKGTMNAHRGIVNRLLWMQAEYGLTRDDRVMQKTPTSFDVSVWELFWPFLTGARLIVAGPGGHQDPGYLRELIQREQITTLHFVPSMLQVFLDQPGVEDCSSLKRVLCSGEALPYGLQERFFSKLGCGLYNLYGPTEAAVDVTSWVCAPTADRRVPIGRPIGNLQIHIVDRGFRPSALGVPGELCIGGTGVGRGYHGRPDLTAEKFVPDPWTAEPGARLYRTGDRARWRPDGEIEFLGRLDHQVKLRGLRIELGEIEEALRQHRGVRDAVVLVREQAGGDGRLWAYVAGASSLEPGELHGLLGSQLPAHMVPSGYTVLPSLPLTPGGKVDRRALPEPELDSSVLERELVPPRTPTEHILARIWSDVLGISEISVHDNFFRLGGHSLSAIRLVMRLREALGTELSLRSLFVHPTIAELAAAVAKEFEANPPAVAQPVLLVEPGTLHEPFPLMDLQQAYWLGRRSDFELGDVSAHIYHELELIDLDVERFELAWQRLIDRHPMLRAVILPDGRQQILASIPPFRVKLLDLRDRDSRQAEAEVEAVRRRMVEHGPALEEWPLFEVCISQLDGSRCQVHINVSLLLCDAISSRVLTMELPRLYANPDGELPSIDLSFRDYVMALRAFDPSETVARSLTYWMDRVPTLPPAPVLPLAARAGRVRRSEFVRRSWALPAEAWTRVKEQAGKAGVTPTVAVLTAYAHALAAWSKSRRFTLNILYFNRRPLHPHVDRIVGNFSSTVLLEVDLSAKASFGVHAKHIQERLWQDMEHGWISGVRVLRELNRLQGATGRAVMPVVFTSTMGLFQEEPAQLVGEGGLRGDYSSGALQTPQVWIDHQVSEREGMLLFNWDVVEDLFPSGLVEEMFQAYCRLLGWLAEEGAWDDAPLPLIPQDQLALMAACNATATSIPEGNLQDPFLRRARLFPDAPAVIASGFRWTYGDLARQAAGLCNRLRLLGAEPNTLVAIVMQKGWEQVAAAIAILESGAAYLPIDPALPRERLWHLLEKGEVRIALTQPWLDRALDWPPELRRLPVESRESEGPGEGPLTAPQRPEDLAYVIFTSGSTGLPKGVMIDHRGALNTIVDINRRFGIGPEDRVLSLSALNFDLSVYDLFGLLAAGGALVLPEPDALREPARWAELIERERVTVWNSVPALMEMLVGFLEGRGERLPASLRLVLLSGDWIPVSLPDRIRRLGSGLEVVSLGGATEASIWSVLYPVGEVDPSWPSIPYGRAMVNQSWQVLDEALEPKPVWVPGDLYIGGAGLAHGYWKDEKKSSASFLVHPVTGERLYRTGDLGRWLPDGNLEFLGREDLQVKIQGYRIELGEIEVALASFPGLRAAVVAALGESRGSKRLVAYVVPAEGESPRLEEELRAFLAAKLPSYMVPASFVVLDSLPLSSNGKVDRQALRDPGTYASSTAGAGLARDETELALVRIWEEVLGTAPVSIYDSFFALGGHSLLAVQLLTRVQSSLGRDLPLSALFEFPTVERLAVVLRQGGETAARRPVLVGIQPRGERLPFFCIHPVGGNVLCYAELARQLGTDQPFYGIQAPDADPEEEDLPLERMAAIYLEAVRQVQPRGPYLLGGWSMGGVLAYEMARQLRQDGEPVALVAMLDAAPLDGGAAAVDDATLAAWFARDLGGLVGRDLGIGAEELQNLGLDEQALRILEQARSEQVLPPDLGPTALARHLAMFKRNFRALLAYVPQPYPGCLSLFAAEEGEGPRAASFWQALAQEGAKVVSLPGNHYSLLRIPSLIQLVESLSEHLSRTSEVTRPPVYQG